MKKVLITVGIIVGALLIISLGTVINNISNDLNIPDNKTNTGANISLSPQTSSKEYYDFIDTNYYTFNYTEDELIKIICGGRNYTDGYRKSASTKDRNTSLYTMMTSQDGFSGIETISITTDTSNYKVKEFSFSFVSNNNLTQDSSMSLLNAYLTQGISVLLGKRNQDMTSQENSKVDNIIQEMLDYKEKGLSYNSSKELKSVTATFTATK